MTQEEFDAARAEHRRTATLGTLLGSVKDRPGDWQSQADLLQAADEVLPDGRRCKSVLTEEEQDKLLKCWSKIGGEIARKRS